MQVRDVLNPGFDLGLFRGFSSDPGLDKLVFPDVVDRVDSPVGVVGLGSIMFGVVPNLSAEEPQDRIFVGQDLLLWGDPQRQLTSWELAFRPHPLGLQRVHNDMVIKGLAVVKQHADGFALSVIIEGNESAKLLRLLIPLGCGRLDKLDENFIFLRTRTFRVKPQCLFARR